MVSVHTVFDCKHELDYEVDIEADVIVPEKVRGLGKCPICTGEESAIPVSGVSPQSDGTILLDSILMIPF